MVRGPRISADLSGSRAAPVGSGTSSRGSLADRSELWRGFSTSGGVCDFVQGELISVRGAFGIDGGRRIVAGLTVNKDQKKARVNGLSLSCERVLVYAFNSILGGTLAPVDALTF